MIACELPVPVLKYKTWGNYWSPIPKYHPFLEDKKHPILDFYKYHPLLENKKHPILDVYKYHPLLEHLILDVNKYHPLLEDKKHLIWDDYCTNSSLHEKCAIIIHLWMSTIIIHFWMKM